MKLQWSHKNKLCSVQNPGKNVFLFIFLLTYFSHTHKNQWKHPNALASSLRGKWNIARLGTVYDFTSQVYGVRAINHGTHEINHLNGRILRPKIPHEVYTWERSVQNSL